MVSLPPLVEPAESLTIDEVRRYSRHLIIPDVGMSGQKRLKNAKVLCVGAGGLGSPAAFSLAAGILILVGSLLSSEPERVQEAVYYKIVGAHRRFVVQVLLLEHGMLGGVGTQGAFGHFGLINLGQRHSHTVVYRSCCVGKSPPTVAWKS